MDTLTVEKAGTLPRGQVEPFPCVLVIGVGERHKHDEQVGLYVARRVREEGPGGAVHVVEETKDVLDLMELWRGHEAKPGEAEVVIVVDAVVDGIRSGTIHRFEICPETGCDVEIPRDLLFSRRLLGLADAVSLARSLGKLPPRLIIYGIGAECFEPGEGLSLSVLAAAEQVTREILRYVQMPTSSAHLYGSWRHDTPDLEDASAHAAKGN